MPSSTNRFAAKPSLNGHLRAVFTKTGTEIGAAAPLFTEGVAGRGLHLVRSSRTHCGDVRQRRRPCNVASDPAPAGQRRCGIVEIGRASCREGMVQDVSISVVDVYIKKKPGII